MRASVGGSLFASAIVLCIVAGCSSPGSEPGSGAAPAARATTRASAIAAAGPVCGATDPALGAHPAHDGQRVPCSECHATFYGSCATTQGTIAFGALARANGATPSWDPVTRTCSGVYCHGAQLRVPSTTAVAWRMTSSIDCSACHGFPPAGPHPAAATAPTRADCNRCHPQTVAPDGALIAAGPHANGALDFAAGTRCDACHAYPPATGAHVAHFDLPGAGLTATYGDTRILQDLFPAATATSAPAAYGFGCGNCHPLDPARHMDGTVNVELWNAAAPAGSLKALAMPTAAYDWSSGTCSGLYCHSTGQATPTYRTTLPWAEAVVTPETRCGQCHGNPPDYAGGNSHVAHVLGMPGRYHNKYPIPSSTPWLQGSFHGNPPQYATVSWSNGYMAPWDSTPMTCQTCHYDTVDPRNTTRAADGTPIGYFYLDTSGSQAALCVSCHAAGGRAATGTGKALPLRHVNGRRDIHLDPRTGDHDGPVGQSFADVAWVPTVPGASIPGVGVRKPPKPYFMTNAYLVNWGCRPGGQTWYNSYGGTAYCPPGAVWQPNNNPDGVWNANWYGTISFSLDGAIYNPATKTCSNVGCHLGSWSYPQYNAPTWGVRARNCFPCHRNP